jgi:hypothetical protein
MFQLEMNHQMNGLILLVPKLLLLHGVKNNFNLKGLLLMQGKLTKEPNDLHLLGGWI